MQIADLHIHSHYSRATSPKMNIEDLARNAKIKGIDIIGTGDFTHPRWLDELKKKLENSSGVYDYDNTKFVLTCEISLIYSQGGKGRRVHHCLLAENFDVVDQINEWLSKKGRLDYDGRPIFGFSSIEFTEAMMSISNDIEIIPAHCLPPEEVIHCNSGIKKIVEVREGDKVLTHKGRWRIVKKTLKRPYDGKILHIIPWYFGLGTKVTREHPFYAIKTHKNCSWTKGICKPTQPHTIYCVTKAFKNYKPTWIQAKYLETGDILLYPRDNNIQDIKKITIDKYVNNNKSLPKHICVNEEFCRLLGYYIAEGYSNSRDCIGFTFNKNETKYIEDVKNLIKKLFNRNPKKGKTEGDILFYSNELREFFENLCYIQKPYRAFSKCLPNWSLELPKYKQVEILRGWWRGDKGSTSSRLLLNQMKMICLRLGIIPSIRVDTKESHEERGKHFIGTRTIKANKDNFVIDSLSFFEDSFGLLTEEEFSTFKLESKWKHGWLDKSYIYIPIRKIVKLEHDNLVYNLEVKDDNSYVTESSTVHNCWTPWFGILGSMGGFNSIEECFQDQAKHIHAIETGLSSDPLMNWRLSSLDKYTLISNSDSHSPYPWRLGREVNVFDLKELTYRNIINAIRTRKDFLFTVEVDPSYGKYHFDGHRNCNISMSPDETKKHNNICPRCNRQLTIGVLHRVEELADRQEGFKPKDAVPFKSIIPLSEIIASITGTAVFTKRVWEIYNQLIAKFSNEFNILLNAEKDDLKNVVNERIADLIIRNRHGKINITPGYDGVYGKPVFEAKKSENLKDFLK